MLFALPLHWELTTAALPFLNAQTVIAINAGHTAADTAGAVDADNHFDSCHFVGGVENINDQLADAVAGANPASPFPLLAAGNFGHALHGAEDFYAHSNWVNLGQTGLFDAGSGYWTPVTPYEVRDGAMVVQGPSPFGDGSVSRDGFVVRVNTGSQVYPGVITGQFGLTPADCPPEAVVGHDELNKDDASRPLFAEARDLAVRQARHDFYRLVQLVQGQYGTAEPLLAAWVKSDPASQGQLRELLVEQSLALGAVGPGGVLTLNAGPQAAGRGPYVDRADGAEAFTITHVSGSPAAPGGEVVDVTWQGLTQRFSATSIAADLGAGNDALTLRGVLSPVRATGGGGADALNIAAAPGTAAAAYTIADGRVSVGAGAGDSNTFDFSGVEQLAVQAADGPDAINIQAAAPGVAISVTGGGGDDAFSVDSNGAAPGGTVDLVRSPLTLAGGAGRNSLVLEDSSDRTADVLAVTPAAVGAAAGNTFFGPGGRLAYTGLASLTLNLPSARAGDQVRLTPSAATAFLVDGNDPAGGAGDVLSINTNGTSGRKKKVTGKDAGVWTFGNRMPVTYAGVEKVK